MKRNSEKEIKIFYDDISEISKKIDQKEIYKLIKSIKKIKLNNGRIFFVGVGGSAANCSHAVNDFRNSINKLSFSFFDLDLLLREKSSRVNKVIADFFEMYEGSLLIFNALGIVFIEWSFFDTISFSLKVDCASKF